MPSDRALYLNPRERVLTTLEHREPDRVPIDLGGTVVSGMHIVAYENLAKATGLPFRHSITDMVQQLATPCEEMLEKANSDFRPVYMRPPRTWQFQEYVSDSGRPYFVDEWGVKWGKNPYYYDMINHPLEDATVKDLELYPWPNPSTPGRTEGLEKEAKNLCENTDFAIVAGIGAPTGGGLFEQAWWLRGFQKFIVDMAVRPEFADALLDKILDVHTRTYEEYLNAVGDHVQVIEWGDDYGMQTGPLISPSLFKKYLKPRDKIFIDFIKRRTDAKVFFHCCGSIFPLIEDLIDVGVDILNPIQPLAVNMGHSTLKKQFGSRMCFHGGLDIQELLPRGTPDAIKEGVRKLLRNMASGGGYIFAAAHNIQADVPPQNALAMFEAARVYGTYPLKI